jgi:hypothetical protein
VILFSFFYIEKLAKFNKKKLVKFVEFTLNPNFFVKKMAKFCQKKRHWVTDDLELVTRHNRPVQRLEGNITVHLLMDEK